MTSLRKNTLTSLLVLTTAGALSLAGAACSGGGDDDDDGNTPLPNPYEACLQFWDDYTEVGPPTIGNRLGLIAFTEQWVTGTVPLGVGETDGYAFLLYQQTFGAGGTAEAVFASTNGSFSVTAPSNSLQQPVSVEIGSAPVWYNDSAGNAATATGGTGDADGIFNDFDDCFGNGDPEDCITGSGDVAIAVGSTNLTIGAGAASGNGVTLTFCRDLSAFSGTTRHEKLKQFAREILSAQK